MPGCARPCPDLPVSASTGSWDPRYTPSRAHVSIRHQAARPPAGVSSQGSNLSRFSPHCMQIACNYRGLSSSREAPKPHFPTFATLPSENLDFHEKSYFYQQRSHLPQSLDPYFLGSPKSMEIQGNLLWRHLRGSESVRGGRRGRPRRSRATKVDRRSAQGALRTEFGPFWVDFAMISGGPKCSAHRQGRVAEHFCQNRLFSLR